MKAVIIYVILFHTAGLALNWYGFLISKMHGMIAVMGYFTSLGAFIYYQRQHNKRKNGLTAIRDTTGVTS